MMRTQPSEAAKSPDGRRVAFFEAGNGSRSRVVVKNADGSHPVHYGLGPLSDSPDKLRRLGSGFLISSELGGLAWSPDGKTLAFVEHRTVSGASVYPWDRLCLLSVPEGRFRGVEISAWMLGSPKWSRDGKHVLLKAAQNDFSPKGEKTERTERWQVDAETGKTQKL